jgi:hypothetical protein
VLLEPKRPLGSSRPHPASIKILCGFIQLFGNKCWFWKEGPPLLPQQQQQQQQLQSQEQQQQQQQKAHGTIERVVAARGGGCRLLVIVGVSPQERTLDCIVVLFYALGVEKKSKNAKRTNLAVLG